MKVLFVISKDHGELFNAMYFSMGQPIDPILMLPPGLYEINREAIAYPTYAYTGVEEIQSVVAKQRPAVVMLFSGYLMVVNELLHETSLDALLSWLTQAGVAVATSDPTGGIAPGLGGRAVEYRPGQRTLSKHLAWLAKRFANYPHVYTAPPLPGAAHALSFFNPAILLDSEVPVSDGDIVRDAEPAGTIPTWLFVLSGEDYAIQRGKLGSAQLARVIAARLADTLDAGRRPILIGPQVCLDEVIPLLAEPAAVTTWSACHFEDYLAALLGSEHVFCWNSFSASLVARGLNRLPFFVFDRGHLSDFLDSFYARAQGQFYHDAQPPVLSVGERLDLETLNASSLRQVQALAAARTHLSQCPEPMQVLRRLCAGDSHAGEQCTGRSSDV